MSVTRKQGLVAEGIRIGESRFKFKDGILLKPNVPYQLSYTVRISRNGNIQLRKVEIFEGIKPKKQLKRQKATP